MKGLQNEQKNSGLIKDQIRTYLTFTIRRNGLYTLRECSDLEFKT